MTTQQISAPPVNQQPKYIVITDEDYEFDSDVNQAHNIGANQVTIKLPSNPLVGQSYEIIGGGASVIVDGNGNTVLNGNTFVGVGVVAKYVFTQNPATSNDDCGAGVWASCCATIPPVT